MAQVELGRGRSAVAVYFVVCAFCFAYFGWRWSRVEFGVVPVFASYRLAITHGLASLPIALLLAKRLPQKWTTSRYAVAVPASLTLLMPDAIAFVSLACEQLQAGFFVRSLIRCFIPVLFAFNWFATCPISMNWASRRAWAWALLLCTAFPMVFGWKQSETCREEIGSSLAGMRLLQALHAIDRFVEISGTERHQGLSLEDWRSKLKQEIVQTERKLTNPIPKNAQVNATLERAMQLLSLSRDTEAEQLLLEAGTVEPQVLLLLAITAREQKDYNKQEMRCRQLLEQSPTEENQSLAYQLLGESLIGQRKILAAIETYEMAIRRGKPDRAEFEMRLGSLLGEAGDVSGAIEHFEQAARIDVNLLQQASKRIRGLKSNSCKF